AFARSDLAIPWNEDYPSLLELAEACDVPVRWSCRTGVCHNCETTLIAGSVGYNPEPVEPAAVGSVLICCSQPRESLLLDLWARWSRRSQGSAGRPGEGSVSGSAPSRRQFHADD